MLMAVHAPPRRWATWFALVASLMNLTPRPSAVLSRGLNALFPVERGDYAQLPALVVSAPLVGLALPLGTVALLGRRMRPGLAPP